MRLPRQAVDFFISREKYIPSSNTTMSGKITNMPAELRASLTRLGRLYADSECSQTVSIKDAIFDECERYGYMLERSVTCKQLGIHPLNRNKQGVHCHRAQTRISNILSVGGSMRAIKENLVAIEVLPDTRRGAM